MADREIAAKCELAIEVLRSFGTLRFAATGWSMLPTIWPGETLVVECVGQDQVCIGDIILVGRDGRLCAHRVIGTAGNEGNPQWITQGDALPVPDRPVADHELLGKVTHVIRAGDRAPLHGSFSGAGKLVARIVRRSSIAARALVYLNHKREQESIFPCQG
jgi:hypothetical protein